MNLKQLEYFVAIAEEGQITAAARRLHISQPPLSYELAQLERELGTQLVRRGPRGVTLTEAGRLLYDRARRILAMATATARGEQADKIAGLSLGADDYVTKPFLPLELVARVKAQLRRYTTYNSLEPGARREGEVLTCRALTLDVPAHEATLNDRPLSLTPTEFSLLRELLEADGAVVSARELYQRIFGDAYYEKGSGSITVHVRHLREKMGDSFEDPKYIRTVWGLGYKIER